MFICLFIYLDVCVGVAFHESWSWVTESNKLRCVCLLHPTQPHRPPPAPPKNKYTKTKKQLGGATLLEDGNKLEDELDVSSGMRLDRSGFDSPYYITDGDRLVCELKRPRVLVTNYALLYSYQLVPILEEIVSACVLVG